jgi:Tfp pilus assembly protein PilV
MIELMVAVAILAMAILGILQAYSVGFMGMADARDRTVATNYAQEKMEEIKNKSFDNIGSESPAAYIPGQTKFKREVTVTKKCLKGHKEYDKISLYKKTKKIYTLI